MHQRGERRKAVRAEVSPALPRPWRTEGRGCLKEMQMTFSILEPQLCQEAAMGGDSSQAVRAGKEPGAMSELGTGDKTPRF